MTRRRPGVPRPITRRTVLGAAAALLAGCSTGPPAPGAAPDGAFPRTVVDAAGTTVVVPGPPRRIVVATEYGALDSLLALGVPPVAAARHFATDWPWAAAAGAGAVPRFPEYPGGPRPEEIAALGPDLVFVRNAPAPAEVAGRLGELAPTVRYDGDDARACLRTVGDAIGRPGDAAAVLAAFEGRLAAAADRIHAAGRTGWTAVTFTVQGDDAIGYWGTATDATILLTGLGLRPSPLVSGTTGYGTLSRERLSSLEADVLLGRHIDADRGPALDRLAADPLFRTVPAVARGRYRRLSLQDSYALGQSSVLSWSAAVGVLAAVVLGLPP